MRLLLGFLAVVGLAACGGSTKADLPPGQHDLGDGTSVAIVKVVDPVPDNPVLKPDPDHRVAYQLKWFNHTDEPVDMTMSHGVQLIDSDGGEATLIAIGQYDERMTSHPSVIPPSSSVTGWEGFEMPADAKPAKLVAYGEAGADAKPTIIDL